MKTLFIIPFYLLIGLGNLSLASRADQLTLGATVTGQISVPGQVNQYTFNGTPGQRLLYDALDTDSLSINTRLIAPSGAVIVDRNSRQDTEPFTLLESGVYTVVADGNGSTVGGYNFRFLDLGAQPPLTLDTVVTKNLDPGSSVDMYAFTGVPGQHLFFDALGANSGATWYMYAPNNVVPSGAGAGIGGDFAATIVEPGPYTLVIYGSSANPVPYSFRVVTSTWTTNTLTLGTPIVGTIAKPGDQQFYTFTGTSGQRLIFDALDIADSLQINARLFSPAGTVVSVDRSSRSDTEPFYLTESGTYTLLLYGAGATVGNYKCRLLDVTASPSLTFDTIVTQTLDPGTSIQTFPFAGTQGQHLYFHGMGANNSTSWYLYSAKDGNIGGTVIGADFEITLPATGPYVLVVYGGTPTPLTYSIQVVREAAPITALTFGTTVSGNIARPGDQAWYTFTGTVGQRIYYDSLDRDFEQLFSRLVSPSGAFVWDFTNQSTDLGPVSLVEAGTYTLIIDGANATTGDYRFRVLDLSQAPPLNLTAPTNGQLTPASATDAYQLNGTAGQRLNFKMNSTTSNQGDWRMVGPANQTLNSATPNFPTDLGDVVLPVTGTYWLLLEGTSDSIAPLSYQFTATDHSDAPVAVSGLGSVRTGTIAAGQQDTLTFTAPAGLWVYYDSEDRTSQNLLAELKDPTGTVVFTVGAANDSGPYVLPHSGSYTMTIRGANATLTGTFTYRLLDLTNGALPLAMNTILTDSLDPGYRTDIYQFQGQVGQRLVYDALENDFANVAVRLIGPDGQVVRFIAGGNSDSDVAPFTLIATGTYYLVFESNLPTPASYKARLLDVATQPQLTFSAPINPTIDPGLGTILYQFTAPAGQRFFFDGLSSSAQGVWYVYDPNNVNLGGTSFNNDFEFVTPQPGLYVLLLAGSSASPTTPTFEAYKLAAQADALQITSVDVFAGSTTLVWNAVNGKVYRVQYTASLPTTTWTDLAGDITATGSTATKVDNSLGNDSKRYYRVRTVP